MGRERGAFFIPLNSCALRIDEMPIPAWGGEEKAPDMFQKLGGAASGGGLLWI
jgi:hypothetical protein